MAARGPRATCHGSVGCGEVAAPTGTLSFVSSPVPPCGFSNSVFIACTKSKARRCHFLSLQFTEVFKRAPRPRECARGDGRRRWEEPSSDARWPLLSGPWRTCLCRAAGVLAGGRDSAGRASENAASSQTVCLLRGHGPQEAALQSDKALVNPKRRGSLSVLPRACPGNARWAPRGARVVLTWSPGWRLRAGAGLAAGTWGPTHGAWF